MVRTETNVDLIRSYFIITELHSLLELLFIIHEILGHIILIM